MIEEELTTKGAATIIAVIVVVIGGFIGFMTWDIRSRQCYMPVIKRSFVDTPDGGKGFLVTSKNNNQVVKQLVPMVHVYFSRKPEEKEYIYYTSWGGPYWELHLPESELENYLE